MSITLLRKKEVVTVTVREKVKCKYFTWKDQKMYFIKLRSAGFYSPYLKNEGPYTKEQIERGFGRIVEGRTVYLYPHIIVKMSDGELYQENFETPEEMKEYLSAFQDMDFV